MSERLFSGRRLLAGSLIFLLALLACGCSTTFLESSGKMANEGSNNHVKPYQGASTQENNGQAVWPAMRMPGTNPVPAYLREIGKTNRAK